VNYTRLALKICGLAFVGVLIVISVFPRSRNLVCGLDTEEKIFEVMKRHLLDPKNNTLAANQLDASIFDNIIHGEITQICRRPKNFWFIRRDPQRDDWPVDVHITAIRKGNCVGCWDKVAIVGLVSRCGVYRPFSVNRSPNGISDFQNGKVYYRRQCPPIPNDQVDEPHW
jgi:hypothetical protein